MTRLASRFGSVNLVRRDRPLTRDELAHYVPSVFSEDKHESRSDRYTYTILGYGTHNAAYNPLHPSIPTNLLKVISKSFIKSDRARLTKVLIKK